MELELDGVTYRVEIAELAAETSEADAAEEDEAAGEDEAAPDVVWAVNARGVLLRAGGLEFLWSASTPRRGRNEPGHGQQYSWRKARVVLFASFVS